MLFQPDNRTSPLHRPIHISLFQIARFHGSKNIPDTYWNIWTKTSPHFLCVTFWTVWNVILLFQVLTNGLIYVSWEMRSHTIIPCLKQMLPPFWMNCFPKQILYLAFTVNWKVSSIITDTLKPWYRLFFSSPIFFWNTNFETKLSRRNKRSGNSCWMLNEIFSVVYQFYKESNLLIRNSDKRIRLISYLWSKYRIS